MQAAAEWALARLNELACALLRLPAPRAGVCDGLLH